VTSDRGFVAFIENLLAKIVGLWKKNFAAKKITFLCVCGIVTMKVDCKSIIVLFGGR